MVGEDVVYELAARLGSIVTFDRHGWVVWMDDFEDNINKWIQDTQGGVAAIALSTEVAQSGASSAKLTTGGATNDYAVIIKHQRYSIPSQLGFEISFCFQSVYTAYIRVGLVVLTGSRRLEGAIRLEPLAGTVECQTGVVTWEPLADISLAAADNLFHTLKLVVDPAAEKYVRLLIDATSYDLAAYGLYAMGLEMAPAMAATFRVTTLSNASVYIYVDDGIMTENEP